MKGKEKELQIERQFQRSEVKKQGEREESFSFLFCLVDCFYFEDSQGMRAAQHCID